MHTGTPSLYQFPNYKCNYKTQSISGFEYYCYCWAPLVTMVTWSLNIIVSWSADHSRKSPHSFKALSYEAISWLLNAILCLHWQCSSSPMTPSRTQVVFPESLPFVWQLSYMCFVPISRSRSGYQTMIFCCIVIFSLCLVFTSVLKW